jgi:hypothetical protein
VYLIEKMAQNQVFYISHNTATTPSSPGILSDMMYNTSKGYLKQPDEINKTSLKLAMLLW